LKTNLSLSERVPLRGFGKLRCGLTIKFSANYLQEF